MFFQKSMKRCSCMMVAPSSSGSMGPLTVMTLPAMFGMEDSAACCPVLNVLSFSGRSKPEPLTSLALHMHEMTTEAFVQTAT